MTQVKYVSQAEMGEETGMSKALGYSMPSKDTIYIRKGIPNRLMRIVKEHEFEHMEKGEEGPFSLGGIGLGSLGDIAGDFIGDITGANRAADAQTAAGQAAIGEQRRQFNITQENLAPYLESGKGGLNRLQQALLQGDISGFQQDPGAQFALNRGVGALDASAAQRGSLFSGAQGKALAEYGQNLGNQEYGNYLNRLMQLANMGLGTAGNLGQFGAQTAGNVGNLQTQIGNVQAQQATQPFNTLMQAGGMGLGFALSDRRLKSDIQKIGSLDNGLNLYTYTIDGERQVGVMADEVKKIMPDAVTQHESGYDMVDYSKVVTWH